MEEDKSPEGVSAGINTRHYLERQEPDNSNAPLPGNTTGPVTTWKSSPVGNDPENPRNIFIEKCARLNLRLMQ